jgi:serine/threonine-protein kinase
MAPKTVGPFEVGDVLGKGGMGEVYRGRHTLLDRAVALKRLIPPDASDRRDQDTEEQAEIWRERFIREGKSLAKMQHENIVAVHDLFEHRKELWLALELVDGFALNDLTRGGAVPVDIACIVALGVVRALEVAHRNHVVHRDIKPQNIMLSKGGVVKLMDFGIARDEKLDTLTKTGSVVGTPSYMAPEIVKGKPADERSDVYAVGAVLYELLSGRRLMAHATPESVFALVATGKFPRLGKVAPQLPWRLVLLVERCLKLDPKRRFQSASELRNALEIFLADHGGPEDHVGRLVGWLVAVGKLNEAEGLTVVEDTSLFIEVVPLKARTPPWRMAALVSTLLLAAALATLSATDGLTELWAKLFE